METSPSKPEKTFWQKLPRYLIILLVLALGGMYLWKYLADQSWENQLATQKETLIHRADSLLQLNTVTLLKVQTRPLAWLVRNELLKGDFQALEGYFAQYSQEDNINQLSLIDQANGKVILETEKDLMGKPFSGEFPMSVTQTNEVVIDMSQGSYRVAVPILGLDRRLATLVVYYDFPQYSIN
ncbi:MAG: hypothetical protein H6581_00850 [Bacteroidia bacterium]|nr:hypothetical protein [Bacteroidia bacterium]